MKVHLDGRFFRRVGTGEKYREARVGAEKEREI